MRRTTSAANARNGPGVVACSRRAPTIDGCVALSRKGSLSDVGAARISASRSAASAPAGSPSARAASAHATWAPTRKLAELFYDLRARTEGLQQDLDKSERAFGRLTSFVLRNPVAALAAVGTAALGAAARASQMATEIDASMRRVAASVPKGTAGLSALRQELESISKATGKSQAELGQAAEVIARTGAGSAEEVASRLRAAVDA